jgi:hypothetical protein
MHYDMDFNYHCSYIITIINQPFVNALKNMLIQIIFKYSVPTAKKSS